MERNNVVTFLVDDCALFMHEKKSARTQWRVPISACLSVITELKLDFGLMLFARKQILYCLRTFWRFRAKNFEIQQKKYWCKVSSTVCKILIATTEENNLSKYFGQECKQNNIFTIILHLIKLKIVLTHFLFKSPRSVNILRRHLLKFPSFLDHRSDFSQSFFKSSCSSILTQNKYFVVHTNYATHKLHFLHISSLLLMKMNFLI